MAGMVRPSRGTPLMVIFRVSHMAPQAKKVARLPTRKSRGRAPAKLRLNSRHPMVSPGTAAGVKKDSTVRASLIRHWMAKLAELGKIRFWKWVRAKYMAPIMAARVMSLVFWFMGIPPGNKKWARTDRSHTTKKERKMRPSCSGSP